jgi:hypothetical protein
MNFKKFLNKKGSAISVALLIASILLFSEIYLMKQAQSQIRLNTQHKLRLQAWFAARAAMQHAKLKCQLLPTQLYDAAEFSVGKNPYFDFSEYSNQPPNIFSTKKIGSIYLKRASKLNIGPRFLTYFPGAMPTQELEKWTKITGFHPDDLAKTSNLSPWPKDHYGKDVLNPEIYLHKFYDDICFETRADSAIKEDNYHFPNGYPYDFSYYIKNFKVVGLQQQRKYNEEAVRLTIEGQSGLKQKTYKQIVSKVMIIKRK